MPTLKVISGGQTGVDQAAIRAARKVFGRNSTGGYAPRWWMTLEGPASWLKAYGLIECASASYATRTEFNVKESDATLRIAKDFNSKGELCTLKYINLHKKLNLNVVWDGKKFSLLPDEVADWLLEQEVKTLNVAGNSERTAPGIYAATVLYLVDVFKAYV